MKIERIISVYKINEDKLFKEIEANDIKLSFIKQLFSPLDDDPNFYRPYKIEKRQYDALLKQKKELLMFPCSDFDLYLEAVSV